MIGRVLHVRPMFAKPEIFDNSWINVPLEDTIEKLRCPRLNKSSRSEFYMHGVFITMFFYARTKFSSLSSHKCRRCSNNVSSSWLSNCSQLTVVIIMIQSQADTVRLTFFGRNGASCQNLNWWAIDRFHRKRGCFFLERNAMAAVWF